MEINKKKTYLYPEYAQEVWRPFLALSLMELVFSLAVPLVAILTQNVMLIVLAISFSIMFTFLMAKPNGSRLSQGQVLKYLFQSLMMKRFMSMRPRNIKPLNARQIRYTQDYMKFNNIEDSIISMQNGLSYLYFKIYGNDLNMANADEIQKIINELAGSINNIRLPIQLFCQDGAVNLDHNIEYLELLKSRTGHEFVQKCIEDDLEILGKQKSRNATQKVFYIRLTFFKDMNIEGSSKQIVEKFVENGIYIEPANREELKQMLCVHYLGEYGNDFPDSELEVDVDKETRDKILKRKSPNYFEMQKRGIWTFKEYLAPLNVSYFANRIKWGNRQFRIMVIKGYQSTTNSSPLLEGLTSLKGVTASIYLNPVNLRDFFKNAEQQTNLKKATVKSRTDVIDSELSEDELVNTYKRLREEHQSVFYVSVYLMLEAHSKEELDELEELVNIEADKMKITIETLDAHYLTNKGFMACSPIGEDYLGHYIKQNLPSESASNLYPFTKKGFIDPRGMLLGHENIGKNQFSLTNKGELSDVFMVDFFEKTISRVNHNILINGNSGTGKTILAMLIFLNYIKQGAHVDFLDVEGTYVKFFERLGCQVVELTGQNDISINPLHIRIPEEKTVGVVNDYISQVRKFMKVYKQDWNSAMLDAFEIYVKKAYDEKGINNYTDISVLKSTDYPILEDIYNLIEKDFYEYEKNHDRNIINIELYRSILLGMTSCVRDGADASLFNRHTSLDIDVGRGVCFNLKSLKNGEVNRKLAQMVNIQTWIQTNVYKNTTEQKFVLGVDEAHILMNPEYAETTQFLEEAVRLYRKYKGSLLLATQTSDEFLRQNLSNSNLSAFFSIPTYKFFFSAGDIDYLKFKEFMNLTDKEIAVLSTARKGKCIFKCADNRYDISVSMPEWFKEVKMDA